MTNPSRPTVAEVQRRLANAVRVPRDELLALENDPRAAVRKLVEAHKRERSRRRAEQRHERKLHELERSLQESGLSRVAGVDEAGAGPLAGPVVAAAVVFPPGTRIKGVDDSKKLTPEVRFELVDVIRDTADGVGVGVADVEEIDALNIYHAGLLAMRRAVQALPSVPDFVVTDARTIPNLGVPQDARPKADASVFCVAAASIVAKTYRDELMSSLDLEYPGYGLAKHKGYATPEHQEAIRRLGPSPIHRASYGYVRELCGEYSRLFYELCAELAAVHDRPSVEAALVRLEESRVNLTGAEYGKLKILALRRRRRWFGKKLGGRRNARPVQRGLAGVG
jgi:ribonuclease HII